MDFAWIVTSVSYEQLGQIVEQFLFQNKVKMTLKESSTRQMNYIQRFQQFLQTYTSNLLPSLFKFIHDKLECFLIYFSHIKQKS